jgi:hypothetical protein
MSDSIRETVCERYALVAQSGLSGNADGVRSVAEAFGHTTEDVELLFAAHNLSLARP